MALAQVCYVAEKACLETVGGALCHCVTVWSGCLFLDGPLVSYFIDTPSCLFTPPPSQSETGKCPGQADNSVSKKPFLPSRPTEVY